MTNKALDVQIAVYKAVLRVAKKHGGILSIADVARISTAIHNLELSKRKQSHKGE